MTVDLRQIPLTLLKPTEHNPRRIRPDDPKLAELAASIKASSQLQPGIARPHPKQKGCFELLAGCRRWWGCQMAGLETMDVIVKDLDDKTARDVTVLENLQRDELSPLEEASGIQMLVEAGHGYEDISSRIGKSVKWIKRRAQLTNLIPAWVARAEKLKLGPPQLELIARYDLDMQTKLLEEMGDWDLSGRNSMESIRRTISTIVSELRLAPWKLSDATLAPKAGSCDDCTKRSDRNPELFDDLPQAKGKPCAQCLDPACWLVKMEAHMARASVELKQKHPNLVQVSSHCSPEPGATKVIGERDYQEVSKSQPGAVPGLLVDGEKQGRVIWVKLNQLAKSRAEASSKAAKAKASGEPVKSMEERRAALESRRKALAIDHLRDAIGKVKSVPTLSLKDVAQVASIFGTSERADHFTKSTWNDLDKASKASEDEIRDGLLRCVLPVFIRRLVIYQTSEADIKWVEAEKISKLLVIDLRKLKADADLDIPEPKSWAKEAPAKVTKKASKS